MNAFLKTFISVIRMPSAPIVMVAILAPAMWVILVMDTHVKVFDPV